MKNLFSLLVLAALFTACTGEQKESTAASPTPEAQLPADSLEQTATAPQSLEATTLKTTQEVDSLLDGI